jgi:hypothetical protein
VKRLRWFDLILVNLFWFGLNIRNNSLRTIFVPYLVDRFVDSGIRMNGTLPGLGYFCTFGAYAVLFLLSVASLRGIADG